MINRLKRYKKKYVFRLVFETFFGLLCSGCFEPEVHVAPPWKERNEEEREGRREGRGRGEKRRANTFNTEGFVGKIRVICTKQAHCER